jgi:hypothetical protein
MLLRAMYAFQRTTTHFAKNSLSEAKDGDGKNELRLRELLRRACLEIHINLFNVRRGQYLVISFLAFCLATGVG